VIIDRSLNKIVLGGDKVLSANGEVNKHIGIDCFLSTYNGDFLTIETENLRKYAEDNPQSWKIRFIKNNRLKSAGAKRASTTKITKVTSKFSLGRSKVNLNNISEPKYNKNKQFRMTGKKFGNFPKETSNNEKVLSLNNSQDQFTSKVQLKTNGKRSVIKSHFSPDSSAISELRRENKLLHTRNDNMRTSN
jgi:hypothetical protein